MIFLNRKQWPYGDDQKRFDDLIRFGLYNNRWFSFVLFLINGFNADFC